VLKPAGHALIGSVRLSAKRFKASDVTPGILLVQLGHVGVTGDGVQVEPLSHFDLRLTNRKGKDLGLLTRLRDVVPGSYAFGITGRGPRGVRLPAGNYRLRLLAFPTAGGPAVARSVVFAVE
jgi:hypothetical protein